MITIPQPASDNMETIRALNAIGKQQREENHRLLQAAIDAYFKEMPTFNAKEK